MAEIDCSICGSKVEEDELDTHKSQAHSDFTEMYAKENMEDLEIAGGDFNFIGDDNSSVKCATCGKTFYVGTYPRSNTSDVERETHAHGMSHAPLDSLFNISGSSGKSDGSCKTCGQVPDNQDYVGHLKTHGVDYTGESYAKEDGTWSEIKDDTPAEEGDPLELGFKHNDKVPKDGFNKQLGGPDEAHKYAKSQNDYSQTDIMGDSSNYWQEGGENEEDDQRDMVNDINKNAAKGQKGLAGKWQKLREPWETGSDWNRDKNGNPIGDEAGASDPLKKVADISEGKDEYAVYDNQQDAENQQDERKEETYEVDEDYTETCDVCGKVFDNPADAGFHAVKHDTDKANEEEDDKVQTGWLDPDSGELVQKRPKRLHTIGGKSVPREADEDTSEYEVDIDEYLKTGEPTQKLPTDKRAGEASKSDFFWVPDGSEQRDFDSADKIMTVASGIWDKHGWGSGGEVDQSVYEPELKAALSGVPITKKAMEILENENYHTEYGILESMATESLGKSWHTLSTEKRANLFEAIGLTQSDAYTLAGLDYRYLTEAVKKDIAKEARYNFDLEDTTEDIEDEEKEEDKDETDEAYEFIYNLEENHRSRDFKKKNLTCTRCNESFYSSKDRNVHFNDIHMKAREYELPDDQPAEECPFCNQLIREPETLDWHMSEQHGAHIPSTYTQTGIQGAMADADDFGIDQDFYSESKKRANEGSEVMDFFTPPESEEGPAVCDICGEQIHYIFEDELQQHLLDKHINVMNESKKKVNEAVDFKTYRILERVQMGEINLPFTDLSQEDERLVRDAQMLGLLDGGILTPEGTAVLNDQLNKSAGFNDYGKGEDDVEQIMGMPVYGESRASDLKKEIKKLTNFINMASFENPMNMGDDQAKLDSLKAELASLGESRANENSECLMGGKHEPIDSPDKFDPYNACKKCGNDIRLKGGEWVDTTYDEREAYNKKNSWESRAKEDWSQYDHADLYPTDPEGDEWRDEGTLMQSNYDMSQQDMNRLYVDAMKEAITRAIQEGGEQMNWNYWEDLLNGWNTHTAMFDLPGTKGETPEAQQAFTQAHQEVKNWFRDQKQSVSATYPSPSWESVTNVLKAEEKDNYEGDKCPKCGSNNTVFGSTVDSMAEDQPEYLVCNKCDARFDADVGIISESRKRAKESDTTKNCPLCGKSVDMGNDDEFYDKEDWKEKGTVAMPYKMEGHFEEDHTPEDFGLDRATTHDGWTGNMSYDLYKKHFGYESRANEVFTKVSDFFENIDSNFSGDCKLCGDSMVQGAYAYEHLGNKHGINVSSLTQDFTGESYAKETKSDAETIQDWWQLISEGNGEGDYMSMAGTGRPENSPNWEEGDPTMWEEFSSSQQQALISKAGGIGGMQERLDNEGWDGYGVDEDDAYESVSNILNEGGPRSGRKPSEMSDNELDERESKNFYEDKEDDDELDEEQAKRFYEDNESRKKGRERLDPQKTDITVCVYCGRSIDSHSNPNTDYRGMKGDAPSTDHYFSGGELGDSDDKYDFESLAKEDAVGGTDTLDRMATPYDEQQGRFRNSRDEESPLDNIYQADEDRQEDADSGAFDSALSTPYNADAEPKYGGITGRRTQSSPAPSGISKNDPFQSPDDVWKASGQKADELYGQDDPDEILGGSFGTPEDTANDLYNMTSHNYNEDEYFKWSDKIAKKVGRNDTGSFDSNSLDNWLRSQGVNNQDLIFDLVREFGGGSKALETGDTD